MSLRRATPYLLLLLAVFLVYSNVYGNEFLYDDEFLIQKNLNLRAWSGLWKSFLMSSTGGSGGTDAFYRPMQGLLYTIVFQLFDLSPFGFHLLNVLLHAVNACLIFILAQRLGFTRRGGFWAALLWCVHPLHTEAVTYQSATADPLHTLFVLLGLIALVPRFSVRGAVWAAVAFALALLSKESAIVFPALAVVCRFFTLAPAERWRWRRYLVTLPLWILAAAYFVSRKTFLDFDRTFDFYKVSNIYTENILFRIYTFLATLPSYLELLIYPHNLHMDRIFPVFIEFTATPVLLGAGLVALGAMVFWREQRRNLCFWSLALLWFAAAHVPHSGILLPVNSFFLEHWLYLPTIGLFICLGALVKGRAFVVAAAAVFYFATVTWKQNQVWADPVTFYTYILQSEPRVARIQNNLAMALSDRKQDQAAIVHYEEAIRLSDEYPQTHHNLALSYLRMGREAEAVHHLERALEINPNFYQSAAVLAQYYAQKGDSARAKIYQERYDQAVEKLR